MRLDRGADMTRQAQAQAQALIRGLALAPHPEGGHYREVFRSPALVSPGDGRSERAALTAIYFLLANGELSRWHRVLSDEIWNFYEGDPLELWVADASFTTITQHRLGPFAAGSSPLEIVPAGAWQAARPTGAYSLVGCAVGPGFDFADFTMLRDCPELAAHLRESYPEYLDLL